MSCFSCYIARMEKRECVLQFLTKPPPWEGAAETERVLLTGGTGRVAASPRRAAPRRRRSLIMMVDIMIGLVCVVIVMEDLTMIGLVVVVIVVVVCEGGFGEIGWNIESMGWCLVVVVWEEGAEIAARKELLSQIPPTDPTKMQTWAPSTSSCRLNSRPSITFHCL